MSAHSPGPWTAGPTMHSPVRVVANDGNVIAKVYLTAYGSRKRDATHAANLAAILAAPDLLAVMQKVLSLPGAMVDMERAGLRSEFLAAIAKATTPPT